MGNLMPGQNFTGGLENKLNESVSNRKNLNQTGFLTNALLSNRTGEVGACFSCSLLLLLNGGEAGVGEEGNSCSCLATPAPAFILLASFCRVFN